MEENRNDADLKKLGRVRLVAMASWLIPAALWLTQPSVNKLPDGIIRKFGLAIVVIQGVLLLSGLALAIIALVLNSRFRDKSVKTTGLLGLSISAVTILLIVVALLLDPPKLWP